MSKPKSSGESEETKEVAKALGVDLDDDTTKKAGKESDPDKKTDTKAVQEEGRDSNLEKSKDKKEKKEDKKEEPDYKKMYADSTKEFQKKYKPMEEKIGKIEELSGKSVDEVIELFKQVGNDNKESDSKKDAPEKKGKEVKISSLEERLASLEQKTGEIEEKDKLAAKQTIEDFRSKYNLSEDDYIEKINPLLDGIKSMRNQDGDPYTLEEGLELAYIIANKDNIDKVVENKVKTKEKELEMAFSPKGKQPSEPKEEDAYSEQQQEIAKRMGVDLNNEEE